MRRSAAIAAIVVILAACGPARPAERPLRVLFVGNSLTYVNDLPGVVEDLAKAARARRLDCETVAYPDYSLEDHWKQGAARRLIADGGWDVVVLQQGPSASEEGRASLLEYTRRFAEEIRRRKARPALYMVWPASSRAGDFDRSSESYRMAADENDAMLFAAGEAWRAAWRRDAALGLYGEDGLHPSPTGTYLAALVVYARLSGHPPSGLPAPPEMSQERAALLQAAAAEAGERFGR